MLKYHEQNYLEISKELKLLHFGKLPKNFVKIWHKFRKILGKFANFGKISKHFQQCLTKI